MGITCYMIRPTARFIYWHQSTMARPSQMAIRSPQHKCPNERQRAAIARGRKSAIGTKQTYKSGAMLSAKQRKKRHSSNFAIKGAPALETHGPLLGQKPITPACQIFG
jgi:hypothetical protein